MDKKFVIYHVWNGVSDKIFETNVLYKGIEQLQASLDVYDQFDKQYIRATWEGRSYSMDQLKNLMLNRATCVDKLLKPKKQRKPRAPIFRRPKRRKSFEDLYDEGEGLQDLGVPTSAEMLNKLLEELKQEE